MDKSQEFAMQISQIIQQLFFIEKSNIFLYENKLKLYPSEIHLMLLINSGHISNSTEMANKLRVTKGAVSQTISRLVNKGILKKSKDPYKKNELTLSFTAFGEKVLKDCQKLQSYFFDNFVSYFQSLSKNDQVVINHFLSFLKELYNSSKIKP